MEQKVAGAALVISNDQRSPSFIRGTLDAGLKRLCRECVQRAGLLSRVGCLIGRFLSSPAQCRLFSLAAPDASVSSSEQ